MAASDLGPEGEAVSAAIESHHCTGRALVAEDWIAAQEKAIGRAKARRRPGSNFSRPKVPEASRSETKRRNQVATRIALA